MSTIFAWARSRTKGRANYGHVERRAKPLELHFSRLAAHDITDKTIETYRAVRVSTVSSKTGNKLSSGLVDFEVVYLSTMLSAYNKAHGLPDSRRFSLPKNSRPYIFRTLARADVRRIVQAVFGSELSVETARMKPLPRARRLAMRRTYAHIVRAILIGVLSGTSDACMRRLRWEPHPDGDVSWIDIEAGQIHRLGPDEPAHQGFKGIGIPLPEWLLRRLRVWHRADRAAGIITVIHLPGGQPLSSQLSRHIAGFADKAGIEEVTPGLLIDTCAATAIRHGEPIYGVAMLIGCRPQWAKQLYDHFRPDYQDKVIAAWDNVLNLKP